MRRRVIGCNHRSAGVELRERLAFDQEAVGEALTRFRQQYPATEAVLVSTCNRMELYWACPEDRPPEVSDVIGFIARFHKLDPEIPAEALYNYEDVEMIRNLFRVASSMDSMVLGESQILGQVKSAYEIARTVGTVGKTFGELFPRAFTVAKDIHTHTAIATGRVSIGSTAVDLAKQIFSHFDDKTVCMAGAGEMGELTLTHLLTTRPSRLWVTNRTDQRAIDLADQLRAKHQIETEPIAYATWIDRLAEVDILISCTGSRRHILTAEAFASIPARRKYRPMLLIDIAVPRDIDPVIGDSPCVFLYNIDDLQTVTESTLSKRREAIRQCHQIIEANVLKCVEQEADHEFSPLITALRRKFHQIGQAELDRVSSKLHALSDHDRELVSHMVHRIAQKMLHDPLELLHDKAGDGSAHVYADALRALFKLKAQPREDQAE